ncbi:MAG: histidine phosphatase family protein [Methanobacteriota archaeon]
MLLRLPCHRFGCRHRLTRSSRLGPLAVHKKPDTPRARIVAAVARAAEGRGRVLLVAHGGTNRLILVESSAMRPGDLFRFEQDHACLNVIDWPDRVRAVNGTFYPK